MLLIKREEARKSQGFRLGRRILEGAHPPFFPQVIPLELAPSRHLPIDIFNTHQWQFHQKIGLKEFTLVYQKISFNSLQALLY